MEKAQIEYITEKKEIINQSMQKKLIQHDVPLKSYNTFRINVKAKNFIEIKEATDLEHIYTDPDYLEKQKIVIGGGSNILFTKDIEGLVLKIDIKGIKIIKENDNYVYIEAGAGENWHAFVEYCVNNNYGGIENMSLIPGTVGASPVQNIGAYGAELKNVLYELEAFDTEKNKLIRFKNSECKFKYRQSIFKEEENKGRYIITSVIFKLSKKPKVNISYEPVKEALKELGIKKPTIKDISNIVIKIREEKLPNPDKIPNAGSFFKNPEIPTVDYQKLKKKFPEMPGYRAGSNKTKIPAAWLIEKAGWKGKRIKEVGTYPSQPLVIVNYGNAKPNEVYEFAQKIKLAVKAKFEIKLEEEINLIS